MTGEHAHADLSDAVVTLRAELADCAARLTALEDAPKPPAAPTYGVPAGTPLATFAAAHKLPADTLTADRLIVKTPGAVFDSFRFDVLVEVRAPGVKFTRCEARGAAVNPANSALILVNPAPQIIGQPSATVEDCTLAPRTRGYTIDGIRGSNWTARRCDISGTVDGAVIYGRIGVREDPTAGNVLLDASWIHDLPHYDYDGGVHADGSHNDGVQIAGGRNIIIRGNRIDPPLWTSAILMGSNVNTVADVTIEGNHLGNAPSSVNAYDFNGVGIPGLRIVGNALGKGGKYAFYLGPKTAAGAVVTGNVWSDGSQPAPVVSINA